MVRNVKAGDGHRDGAVSKRSQVFNLQNEIWVKRNKEDGRFMNVKSDGKPHKSVRKEN